MANMAKPQSIIGAPVGRVEGAEKVSGKAIYAADVHYFPDALWGKILRSPYPHARIVEIDASKAWKVAGVKAVVTGKDEPGRYVGKSIRDIPVLAGTRCATSAIKSRRLPPRLWMRLKKRLVLSKSNTRSCRRFSIRWKQ